VPDPEPLPVTGPPWAAVAPEGAATAVGLAARLGAYCWAEQQVFSLLGAWVPEIAEPDAKVAVAAHADHAGWRAQRWYELLPDAPPGADALVVAPAAVVPALDAAAAVAGGEGRTVEKLAVAHRVLLPRLAAAMRAHLDWGTELAEPAVLRVLRVALDDVLSDWVVGERLLQALVDDPADVDRVAEAHAAVERPLVAAGGLLGPGSTGRRPPGWRS
jgi:hypothetical protein